LPRANSLLLIDRACIEFAAKAKPIGEASMNFGHA
jgi:hypothetical protein